MKYLTTLKGCKAKIYVDSNVPPKYCRARSVPYSMQTLVEQQLDKLEKDGVIEPVQHSEWAAPIVPVLKSDKSVQICGDFKQAVNHASRLDKYPIPRIEDLFAKLAGGRKFELVTDHKPLLTLFDAKRSISPQASGRIQRWALLLSMYEYSLSYKSTHAHGNADALSRLPLPKTPRDTPQPMETVLMMEHLNSTPITATRIRTWTHRDPLISRGLPYIQHGWPEVMEEDELKPFWRRKVELSCQDGCILWGNRVVVPKAGCEEVLRELHDAHTRIARFLFNCRISPQSTTGVSLVELLMGRRLRSTLDLLKPDLEKRVTHQQAQQKQSHDVKTRDRNFEEGEEVYAQNFGSGEKWVPAKVVEVLGPRSCEVELWEDKRVWRRHIENLRHRYVEDSLLTADAPNSTAPRTPVEYPSFLFPTLAGLGFLLLLHQHPVSPCVATVDQIVSA